MLMDGGPLSNEWSGFYRGVCEDCGHKTRLQRLAVQGNVIKSPRFEMCPRCKVQLRWKQENLPEGLLPVLEEEEVCCQRDGNTISSHVRSVIGRLARSLGIFRQSKLAEKSGV